MKHDCHETGCLFCMVSDLYIKIDELKHTNHKLASENITMKYSKVSPDSSVVERGFEAPGVGGAIPSQGKNFYFKGQYFDTEAEFWAYVKQWPSQMTDTGTFSMEWERLGRELWTNMNIYCPNINNGELNQLLTAAQLNALEMILTKFNASLG